MNINKPEYSSCDIYFDPKDNSLKNLKAEIIAVLKQDKWEASIPEKTYSLQIQKELKKFFEGTTPLDPEELVTELKKIFAKVKKKKISDNEWMNGGCIALEVESEEIKEVQNLITSFLTKLNLDSKKIENPHISTAYLQGYNKFSELSDMIKNLANYKYNFTILDLEILHGATTNEEYLVLSLKPPSNFNKALKLIENSSDTIKFPNGFKSHLSLLLIPSNSLTSNKKNELLKLMQDNKELIFKKIKIKPKAISLFNGAKLLELRSKLKEIT